MAVSLHPSKACRVHVLMTRAFIDSDCTRTPYIAWGSSIRPPIRIPISYRNELETDDTDLAEEALETNIKIDGVRREDDLSAMYELTHIHRHDIDQVDISALMAGLVGMHWPKNSVGIFPSDLLDLGDEEQTARVRASLAVGNARALVEQMLAKEG